MTCARAWYVSIPMRLALISAEQVSCMYYVVSYCDIPAAFIGESPCPLFQNEKIVQQPADFLQLTENYVKGAESFIKTNASMLASQFTTEFCSLTSCSPACPYYSITIPLLTDKKAPFFLYMAFQHTHHPQFASKTFTNSSVRGKFGDALNELDWAVGQVFQFIEDAGVKDNTFVFFTSDNG